jgi:hypothetical protein
MYGTVATLKAKPGTGDQLASLAQTWWRERGPNIPGIVGTVVYRTDRDPNEYILVALARSKEEYFANAADPEQDRWYQQIRALLESDPVWTDGEIIFEGHV